MPLQILLARLSFFALLLVVIVAVGWFLYPATWASQFGDTAPYILRRAAWGMALFFFLQFVRLLSRWITVYRGTKAGHGWVDWSIPPFPAYRIFTVAVAASIMVMLVYAFSYFGQLVPRPGTDAQQWASFALVSLASFFACSIALDIMARIDKNIEEVLFHS